MNEQAKDKKAAERNEDGDIATLIKHLKEFQDIVPIDCALTITDTEKYVAILSGEKIKIPESVIDSIIPEVDSPYKAIHTGKPASAVVPASAIGFTYRSSSTPIRDEQGNIVGAMGLAISLDNRENIINMANNVAMASEQTSAAVEELAASSEQLSSQENDLKNLVNNIRTEVEKTNNILNFINGVAKTSNILGLNASIEAARAGELGKGFSVVANEIRKMSKDSSDGVKNIENLLFEIKSKIEEMNEKIGQTDLIASQQTSATIEISSSIQQLTATAEQLKLAANNVIG